MQSINIKQLREDLTQLREKNRYEEDQLQKVIYALVKEEHDTTQRIINKNMLDYIKYLTVYTGSTLHSVIHGNPVPTIIVSNSTYDYKIYWSTTEGIFKIEGHHNDGGSSLKVIKAIEHQLDLFFIAHRN